MSINLVNSLEENAWREFVVQHPLGNIFHTPEMFQVFAHAKGHHPVLQATVDNNGEILALLVPVQITLMDGLLRILSTRAIAYGSVLCNADSQGKLALANLLSSYTDTIKHQALFTELRNLTDLSDLQAIFEQTGFMYSDHLDYLINLNGTPEQVLQNIGARTRKHIRQGLRKGKVIVELIEERNQLDIWYGLVRKTYHNARVPLADRSLFDAAFDILYPKRMIQFWLARIGSNYVAASAELLYKKTIYGWYSGVDRGYNSDLPSEMLMWYILAWGSQNGYITYDFGGAGKPNEKYGVRDFKAKFGGRLVCYGRNIHIHSPLLFRLSTLGYQISTHRWN
ncbi:MAG: hypothetical protein A2Y53_05195 [Chloroflexi bacterium RBG_16_47_49]|nr:MAG: hypothetical protein A2Y53_05195 [Chloroflexi bacterium RBG_16_47_49]